MFVKPVERFSENGTPPAWVEHEHVARYQWAADLVRGKDVLDCACGTGHGASPLIAAGAACVDGFDLDPESIAEARRRQPHERARFRTADGTSLPVADSSFDVYLSFETIEHIADDHAYLREARRVLRPGGMFVCSTPNREVTNPGTGPSARPYNRFHVREYTRSELDRILLEHFDTVSWFAQTIRRRRYVRALGKVGRVSPTLAVRCHQARKLVGLPLENIGKHRPAEWPADGVPEVLVAVCSSPRARPD